MCGIAGFFGKPDRKFNETILNYLMLMQDARGRDNFGIAYTRVGFEGEKNRRAIDIHRGWDGRYVHGGVDTSTFNKVMEKKGKLWMYDEFEWSSPIVIIGHSRAASRGGDGIENAHPFVCKDSEEEGVTARTLVGVHNGTILNHEDVASSLDIDIGITRNDSKAMLMCMAHSNEKTIKALQSYRGAGAFVWHIKEEPNRVYVWVGNESNKRFFSQERPLHYIETVDGIYISSLRKPLEDMMLCVSDWPTYLDSSIIHATPFATDAITVIENGEIIEKIPVKRSPLPFSYYTKKSKKQSSSFGCGDGSCEDRMVYSSHSPTSSTSGDFLDYAKIIQKDRYSASQIEDFRSVSRLYMQGGLYYLNGKLAHTKVDYDEEVLEVSNILSECFTIIGPTLFTKRGWVLQRRGEGDYRFLDGNDTKLVINENTSINTLYFYKGLLVKDKEHLLRLHHNMIDVGVEKSQLMRSSTDYPVWVGLFNPSITIEDITPSYESVIFAPPKLASNKTSPISGIVKFPYVDKAYYFKRNMIVEVLDELRYIELKDYARIDFCNKCSKAIPFAFTCEKCVPYMGEEEEEESSFSNIIQAYTQRYRVMCLDCACDDIQSDKNMCEECGSINVNSTPYEEDKASQFFES